MDDTQHRCTCFWISPNGLVEIPRKMVCKMQMHPKSNFLRINQNPYELKTNGIQLNIHQWFLFILFSLSDLVTVWSTFWYRNGHIWLRSIVVHSSKYGILDMSPIMRYLYLKWRHVIYDTDCTTKQRKSIKRVFVQHHQMRLRFWFKIIESIDLGFVIL